MRGARRATRTAHAATPPGGGGVPRREEAGRASPRKPRFRRRIWTRRRRSRRRRKSRRNRRPGRRPTRRRRRIRTRARRGALTAPFVPGASLSRRRAPRTTSGASKPPWRREIRARRPAPSSASRRARRRAPRAPPPPSAPSMRARALGSQRRDARRLRRRRGQTVSSRRRRPFCRRLWRRRRASRGRALSDAAAPAAPSRARPRGARAASDARDAALLRARAETFGLFLLKEESSRVIGVARRVEAPFSTRKQRPVPRVLSGLPENARSFRSSRSSRSAKKRAASASSAVSKTRRRAGGDAGGDAERLDAQRAPAVAPAPARCYARHALEAAPCPAAASRGGAEASPSLRAARKSCLASVRAVYERGGGPAAPSAKARAPSATFSAELRVGANPRTNSCVCVRADVLGQLRAICAAPRTARARRAPSRREPPSPG